MGTLIIVGLSAIGLVWLGKRILDIGSAQGFWGKARAVRDCILDWTLSLGLAAAGAFTGGVIGGVAGLIAGPILSGLISFGNRGKQS